MYSQILNPPPTPIHWSLEKSYLHFSGFDPSPSQYFFLLLPLSFLFICNYECSRVCGQQCVSVYRGLYLNPPFSWNLCFLEQVSRIIYKIFGQNFTFICSIKNSFQFKPKFTHIQSFCALKNTSAPILLTVILRLNIFLSSWIGARHMYIKKNDYNNKFNWKCML